MFSEKLVEVLPKVSAGANAFAFACRIGEMVAQNSGNFEYVPWLNTFAGLATVGAVTAAGMDVGLLIGAHKNGWGAVVNPELISITRPDRFIAYVATIFNVGIHYIK